MRLQGRVEEWRDEQGFGFIRPQEGGERIFLHISECRNRNRRPVVGDLVTYEPGRDSRGRRQAKNLQFVADRRHRRAPRQQRRFEFYLLILIVIFLPTMVAIGRLSGWVLALYVGVSVLTFLLYAGDKSAARRGGWRTPESTLHFVALIGGWPGALLAQEWLRHKSRKQEFRAVFWMTVAMNLALLGWLLTDRGTRLVADLVSTVGLNG